LQRNKTTLLVLRFILVVVIIYGCKDCTMRTAGKIKSG
jgi:hypothetical protein